jgi:RNA polymerase sigma-70 factor (ECF subfamily)
MTNQIFEQQVLPAKDKMFRFALRMLGSAAGSAEDARDIVQDALLTVWDQKEQLAHIQNPEAWCMQITKNLCLDRLKERNVRQKAVQKLKAEKNLIDNPNSGAAYETQNQIANMDQIKKIINGLPEKYRIVIHLREIEGFTYREISEITEWDMSNVKVNLFRARKELKKQLIKRKVYDIS